MHNMYIHVILPGNESISHLFGKRFSKIFKRAGCSKVSFFLGQQHPFLIPPSIGNPGVHGLTPTVEVDDHPYHRKTIRV